SSALYAERLTDGLYNKTAFSGTAGEGDTFTVDLGRHVLITEIKLWPSQSGGAVSGADVSNLAIELSNDTLDWVTVASWDDYSGESFTAADALVATPDADTYGRYVRIRKTEAGSFSYGELQVFADVKALEVSRGKTVTANRESNIAPTAFTLPSVVDGITDNAANGWLIEPVGTGDVPCLSIDLGEELPVDWIEMYTRRGIVAGAAQHRGWEVYGLTAAQAESALVPERDATLLFISHATGAGALEANFPVNTEENEPNHYLFETLDGTAYQHLSFLKKQFNVGLAEIAAYTILPEAWKAELSGQAITVRFSQEMDTSTFDFIKVMVNGAEKTPLVTPIDAYTAELTLDAMYYGAKIEVTVPETVKSENGIGVYQRESAFTLFAPAAVAISDLRFINGTNEGSTEITELAGLTEAGVTATFQNNQPDKSEDIIVLAVLYDANRTVIRADEQRRTLEAESEPETVLAGFSLPEDTTGCTLSVFIWKDYNLMKPWTAHYSLDD
ncbi:MAG: discoidin domain-containing protein, partial [Clostridia bacterium]|nr:discoidin domain-containing protein [Clostridia bacterium]